MLIDYDSTFNKIQELYKNSSGEVHKAYSKCLDVISEMPEVDAVEKAELIEDLQHEKNLFQLKAFTGTELKAINGAFNRIIEMVTKLY